MNTPSVTTSAVKPRSATTHKIVARFADGKVVKGHTTNFSPETAAFDITPANGFPSSKPLAIDIHSLKAIFFVRDFEGKSSRRDRTHFLPGQAYQGRKVEVMFKDGELLIGSTPTYGSEMQGFFIFPADPASNTIKVYAVNAAVKKIVWLQ